MIDPEKLARFIKDSGVSYRQNAVSFIFTCPRCHKPRKLYIRKSDGVFCCFRCKSEGFKGRADFALKELLNQPLKYVQNELWEQEPQNVAPFEPIGIDFGSEEVSEVEWIPLHFPYHFHRIDAPCSKPGLEFLNQRGIPVDVALQYNIQYSPLMRRVYFPMVYAKMVLGWQGRTIKPLIYNTPDGLIEIPKYLSNTGIPREKMVMFYDRLVGNHVVLCEGPIDSIKTHLCGGNVATLGKCVTKTQIEMIRNLGIKNFYMGLDPDATPEMNDIIRLYAHEINFYMMDIVGKDLGDLTFAQAYDIWKDSKPWQPGKIYFYMRK